MVVGQTFKQSYILFEICQPPTVGGRLSTGAAAGLFA
jgi:hypothetical protein